MCSKLLFQNSVGFKDLGCKDKEEGARSKARTRSKDKDQIVH